MSDVSEYVQPITTERLEAAGFRYDGAHWVATATGPNRNVSIQFYPGMTRRWYVNGGQIRPPAFWIEVVILCHALGIILTDTP